MPPSTLLGGNDSIVIQGKIASSAMFCEGGYVSELF